MFSQQTKPFCPGYRDKSVCFCTGKQRALKEPFHVKREAWKGPGQIRQPKLQITVQLTGQQGAYPSI